MEEFYLDQSINGQILEEDDIDDALISSAAGVHEAARIQLEGGALSKTNGENSSTFSSLNVAMNRVTTSSSPAKHSASASPQLSSQDTPSQSTTSHPFRPASSNVRDLPGLDVGTAVRITSRNCRHKDMVGTLVAFVGNGKRARYDPSQSILPTLLY